MLVHPADQAIPIHAGATQVGQHNIDIGGIERGRGFFAVGNNQQIKAAGPPDPSQVMPQFFLVFNYQNSTASHTICQMIYYQIGGDYQGSQIRNLEDIIPEAARKLLLLAA
jgi:hypothetical protein